MNLLDLQGQANHLRQKTFQAFYDHGEAHLGGSFSMIEILISLYEEVMEPDDQFILSKAHASFPLCLLLQEKGLHPKLKTHLERDPINGIHATTGSLGHGLPIATGIAMAKKFQKRAGKTIVLMSDGECQEGTTWESLLIGAKHQLDNLLILVDYNKIQALSTLEDALPLGDLASKFRAFNWHCQEVMNGHDFSEILFSFNSIFQKDMPQVILFHTIKGKGIQEFENDPAWHARKIKDEELAIGLDSLQRVGRGIAQGMS